MNEHEGFILIQPPLDEVIALCSVVFIDVFGCYKETSCELE
jgi:hypothetical protein